MSAQDIDINDFCGWSEFASIAKSIGPLEGFQSMTKLSKTIHARIGTCRSGNPFDILYEMQRASVGAYISIFEVQDRVDIFCMCEAIIVRIEKSDRPYPDEESVRSLFRYFWRPAVFATVKPYLIELGLRTSPEYVKFGQLMLLR